MPRFTVPNFLAYQVDGGGSGVPLVAKGTVGTVYLSDAAGQRTGTVVQPLNSDGTAATAKSNQHGVVEGFMVDAPDGVPGVFYVSEPVVTSLIRFVEGSRGPQGLPGVNAIENDEAVGAYLSTPGTASRSEATALVNTAVDNRVPSIVGALVADPDSTLNSNVRLAAAVTVDGRGFRSGPQNAMGGIGAGQLTPADKVSGTAPSGGYEITAFGAGALQTNQRGWKNVAVGSFALRDNVDGYYNTAVGNSALERNTGGIGTAPKSPNDPGARNTAFGSNALRYNLTGRANVAVGRNAAHSSLTGNYNTAVGTNAYSGVVSGNEEDGNLVHSAKSADYVTAVGWGAAFYTDAPQSTAVGCRALYESRNAASYGGTAVGFNALYRSEARENTALGNEAGSAITTGRWNIAIGPRVMSAGSQVTGNANTGIGVASLIALATGQYNIGIGQETLSEVKSGSGNTVVGHQASKSTPVGVNDTTVLGAQAGVNHNNSTALGAQTQSTNVNQTAIGPRSLYIEPRSATPSAPSTGAELWVEKVGSKHQLRVRFPGGSVITLATEP